MKLSRTLPLVILAILLTGCQSKVTTTLDISNVESPSTHVELAIEGDARKAILDDPELDQRLLAFVASESGSNANRSDTGEKLVYSSDVSGSRTLGTLTGVGATTSRAEDDSMSTTVTLVDPVDLRAAIVDATSGEADSGAMSIAWQEAIQLRLKLRLPNNVVSVRGIDPEYVTAYDDTVEVVASLRSWPQGQMAVESKAGSNLLMYFGLASVLVSVIVFVRRRTRHTR